MGIIKKFSYILLFLILFLFPAKALAQEKIDNYDVVITAHRDGSMSVSETIKYDFGRSFHHGIFRNIPLVSAVGNLYRVISLQFNQITRDGQSERYQASFKASEASVKIGDPDQTISGLHTYIIKYTVLNSIGSNYADHDEIYWNVTGNEWPVPIVSVSATITTDFGAVVSKMVCFTGPVDSGEHFCAFAPNAPFNPIITTSPLSSGEGLTVVAGFPVNTFPKSILKTSKPLVGSDFTNFLKIYFGIWLGLNCLLGPYLLFWYNKHKSKIRFGPPSVNFDIPRDDKKKIITPLEAGIIDNTKLDKQDIIATIFDLAIRKYLKIKQIKTIRKFQADLVDYQLIKLKEYGNVTVFEKEILNRFFESGDKILMSDLKVDFYATFQAVETEAFQLLKIKNFYSKNPKVQMSGLLILGLISLIGLNVIFGSVLIYLSRKLNGRTAMGDKIDWQVDGLKIFLKSMSRYHDWQAKNLITVEKYIPYAIALGLHDQFMEQLKIIKPDYHPGWYSGSNNFYLGYPGMYSSFSANTTTVAPSSSSGFSGGSSGGGGGGGGGGSW